MKTTTTQPKTLRQPAVLAWLRLARVYQKVDTASAQLFQHHGLNTAQFDVLARVGAQPGMTQQQLARSLLVTKGNISQLLDRMEQQGLVERRQEGRNKHLYLTGQGQALFEQVVPEQERAVAALFDSLSPEEQRQLLHLLRELDRSLE